MCCVCLCPCWAPGGVVVLVPVRQSAAFFTQLASDAAFAQHVQGILVDDTGTASLGNSCSSWQVAWHALWRLPC
jgi:hypothetical protein